MLTKAAVFLFLTASGVCYFSGIKACCSKPDFAPYKLYATMESSQHTECPSRHRNQCIKTKILQELKNKGQKVKAEYIYITPKLQTCSYSSCDTLQQRCRGYVAYFVGRSEVIQGEVRFKRTLGQNSDDWHLKKPHQHLLLTRALGMTDFLSVGA